MADEYSLLSIFSRADAENLTAYLYSRHQRRYAVSQQQGSTLFDI